MKILKTKPYTFWFVTGCQSLYGEDILEKVRNQSAEIVTSLNNEAVPPYKIEFKNIVCTAGGITDVILEANADKNCAGIITWMHTFSPAKMWINGLKQLNKPLLHLNTQFNVEIPWDTIDMDFMNLNQAAHGDREFGFAATRLGVPRKTIQGHWKDQRFQERMASWMRTAAAYTEGLTLRIACFGDKMRDVAVTDGDRIEAEVQFGWTVDGFPVGDLVERMKEIPESKIQEVMDEYHEFYDFAPDVLDNPEKMNAVREQALYEIALVEFLEEGNYQAFVTSFQDLHGMKQLPGLASQRLMAMGYGFAGEGDWKTAGMVRLLNVISDFKDSSFMEDYTYNLAKGNELVLGSHMLEISPMIAEDKPVIKVLPLDIGGKDDPARLVFNTKPGKGVNAALVDMGDRFRLVVQELHTVKNENKMPSLPTANLLYKPEPSLEIGAESWIIAGGGHHFGFSLNVTSEQLRDWARMANVECIVIDKNTTIDSVEKELRWNDLYYRFNK